MKKQIVNFCIIVLLAQSCIDSQKNVLSEQKNLKISTDTPKNISLNDIDYINLETNSENLFSRIDKLIIHDSLFFFSDIRGAKKVFSYDFEGKFVRTYGHIGKGKGEYLKLTDFDINSRGNIIIYSSPLRRIIEYNIKGDLVSEFEIPFNARGLKCLPNNKILFALTNSNKMNNSMYAIIGNSNKLENTYLSFPNKDKADRVRNPYFFESKKCLLSYIPTRNEFYRFDKNGNLIDTIHFDFGKNTSPKSFMHSAFNSEGDFNKGKSYSYINKTPSIIDGYYLGEIVIDNEAIPNRESEKHIYIANQNLNEVFTRKVSKENFSLKGIFPCLTTYEDHYIISLLDIGSYNMLKECEKEKIPLDVKEHILRNGFSLTLKSKLCIE